MKIMVILLYHKRSFYCIIVMIRRSLFANKVKKVVKTRGVESTSLLNNLYM